MENYNIKRSTLVEILKLRFVRLGVTTLRYQLKYTNSYVLINLFIGYYYL